MEMSNDSAKRSFMFVRNEDQSKSKFTLLGKHRIIIYSKKVHKGA